LAARFRIVGLVRDADSLPKGIDDVLERARAIMVPVFSDLSIEGVERMVIDSHPDCTVVSSSAPTNTAPAKPTNARTPTLRQHHDHNELQLPIVVCRK
jgi:hypothetical protein